MTGGLCLFGVGAAALTLARSGQSAKMMAKS
jgi:hypothetical protein